MNDSSVRTKWTGSRVPLRKTKCARQTKVMPTTSTTLSNEWLGSDGRRSEVAIGINSICIRKKGKRSLTGKEGDRRSLVRQFL